MWLAWGTGATLVPAPCAVFDSHQGLGSWIVDEKITVVATTPLESVSLPIPGMRLAVVDPAGEPVDWGSIGQVVVAGPGLDPHLDPVQDAEKYAPLTSLGWERALYTGTWVRAERDGLIPADAAENPTRVDVPPRKQGRRWQWWPTR